MSFSVARRARAVHDTVCVRRAGVQERTERAYVIIISVTIIYGLLEKFMHFLIWWQ